MLLHTSGLGIIAAIGLLTMGYLGTSFMATSEVAHVLFPTAAIIAPALMREVARRLAFVDNRPAVALALDSCVAVLQLAGLAILAYTSTLTSTMALIVSGLACAVCSCTLFALRRHDFAFASRDALRDFLDNIGLGKWLLASQCTMIAQFTSVQWLAAFALGTEQTGELAACMSIVMVVNPFLTGIGNLLLPRASSIYARESGPGLARVLNGTTAVIAVGMAAFLLGIVLWGSRAFSIVYGARYANAHQVLVILAVGLAFRGGGMAAYLGLWVTGGARGNVLTSLLALGTTIGISLLCVRGLGLIGLAYGMLAGESSAAIVRWILLRRLLNAKLILIPVAT
jgi:O-antigen/teichoic acid export membrane protein